MATEPYPPTINAGLAMFLPLTPIKVDVGIAAGAITSPWWLPVIENIATSFGSVVMWVAGFVLVIVRIAIAIREWRRDR